MGSTFLRFPTNPSSFFPAIRLSVDPSFALFLGIKSARGTVGLSRRNKDGFVEGGWRAGRECHDVDVKKAG